MRPEELMSPSEETPLALVVDDDEVFRDRLCSALAKRRWEIERAADGEEALKVARDRSPDLVLVDLRMPGMGGLDVVQELRSIDSSMTIIVLTGYGSIPTAISAMKKGADHYLSKPADADQILAVYHKLHSAPGSEQETTPTTVPTLARVEWEHLQRVIADCDGNLSQASRLLGIHRRSLQRKLSKYPPSH
jgi:two-component system, response regulator RegA